MKKCISSIVAAGLIIAVLVSAVSLVAPVPTQAQLADTPWPMFHHDPQHTGRSAYSGPATPALKWRYATGSNVDCSPAIGADGTIYVGSLDGYVYALNPDGSLKWSYDAGAQWYGTSSPAIGADGTIYVGSWDHYIYALNPDGSLKWRYDTGNFLDSSPAIGADGTIYVGGRHGYVYALNPDGTLKWRSVTTRWYSTSSPAIGFDGTIYIGSYDHYIYALNPDGSLKWRYATGGPVASSPAIGADGTIYVGSHDHYIYALNPDGSLKWSYATGGITTPCPAIGTDGTIYVGSYDDYIYALNPDGSLKWRYATGSNVDSSPAIGADGTIYVGSQDNHVYALNPDGSLKWSYATGGLVASSPAIGADGTIYVGSYDNYIYAIGEAPDTTPPAAVTDLATSGATAGSITLTWTAPGDDGNVGTASEYDMRYATSTITDANWGTATECTGEPSPQPVGGSESFVVTGLSAETTYYFALKTADEVPNWSDLSNVPSGTTSLIDSDGDGVPDGSDLCADTAQGADVDANGCSEAQVDLDLDGACDPGASSPLWCTGSDNCPSDANPDQFESEQPPDGIGDVCDPDTQNSSGVSGPDGSITLTHETEGITFDGSTAGPYQTVTIEEDAGGIGTIQVTTRGKNRVSNKFDLLSSSLLTGTVTKITDFPDGISQQQFDKLTVRKAGTGKITPDSVTKVPETAPYTQVTVILYIEDDATFTVLVPADTDSDGVYDQFDLNDDGDFDDLGELDNCPNTPNPDQADSDGDGVGDVCEGVDGGEGCFIATAAYGTSSATEIDTLRAFRDQVLLQNSLGSQLVALYYEVSPPVADFISEHEGLRTLVRELLVEPVSWVVEATEAFWRD